MSDGQAHSNQDTPSTTPVLKKFKTVSEGMNTGKFSEDELVRFKEGLELYGREWNLLAKHIVTRDPNAIRSHAQKYFIKLFRDNIPLPAKVIESGAGYTLSGKPLDPESAAARPYLKGRTIPLNIPSQHPDGIILPLAFNPDMPVPTTSDAGDSLAADVSAILGEIDTPVKHASKKPQPDFDSATELNTPSDKAHKTPKSASRPAKKDKAQVAKQTPTPAPASVALVQSRDMHDKMDERSLLGPAERTEYARSRPVRAAAKPQPFDPIALLAQGGGHVMMPCERYQGRPGSGDPGSQPFEISVHRRVMTVMDIHSHLMATEVIGFLAGTWDAKKHLLEITYALPCRSVEPETTSGINHDRHFNVELDPASEVETRELVEKLNLRIVGWYHSHPTFAPDPSLIDLMNQRSYQGLFRQGLGDEPHAEPTVRCGPAPFSSADRHEHLTMDAERLQPSGQDCNADHSTRNGYTSSSSSGGTADAVHALEDLAAGSFGRSSGHLHQAVAPSSSFSSIFSDSTASLQPSSSFYGGMVSDVPPSKGHALSAPSVPKSAMHDDGLRQMAEPFVGAIVGPYDPKLPKSISAINWFYVGNSDDDKNKPKQLAHNIVESEPRGCIEDSEIEKLAKLIRECGQRQDRVNFDSGWRSDRWETKREKLNRSLLFQLLGFKAASVPLSAPAQAPAASGDYHHGESAAGAMDSAMSVVSIPGAPKSTAASWAMAAPPAPPAPTGVTYADLVVQIPDLQNAQYPAGMHGPLQLIQRVMDEIGSWDKGGVVSTVISTVEE
ncbi:hypothetical protein BC831DRAFT_437696 [Entophlyctis helioformis]|nr:hypothetical protein BC831DRAFT_437696 [Entophlyctis helioformis]